MLPTLILASVVFLAVFADLLPLHDPEVSVKDLETGYPVAGTLPPAWMEGGTWRMPLGTDFQSRDILSRVIYGSRVSLIVGLVGTLAAGVIGVTLGLLAGYMGKWWDQIIMRITDAWLALPTLIFAIFLASIRGANLWNIVLILTLVFWSRYARQVRAEVAIAVTAQAAFRIVDRIAAIRAAEPAVSVERARGSQREVFL